MTHHRRFRPCRRFRLPGGLTALLALTLLLALAPAAAQAATFTVNATDDVTDGTCDGTHCSLREAIEAANASAGADRIEFAILGGGPHTIAAGAAFPAIEGDLEIDGYTQDGAQANSATFGGLNTVLQIALQFTSDGLRIAGPRVTIRGLAIGSDGPAIVIFSPTGAEDILIAGNFIGTDVAGLAAAGTGNLGIAAQHVTRLTIGGSAAADRNLIAGRAQYGIAVGRLDNGEIMDVTIQGNLIGTDAGGTSPLGNALAGIYIATDSTAGDPADRLTIGGPDAETANVIAGNGDGILIERTAGSDADGAQTRIEGNYIGTNDWLSDSAPNTGAGIRTIGAIAARVTGNQIRHNTGAGVAVTGPLTDAGAGIVITDNDIANNGGLGIDLGGDGRTPNDADDSDDGPNALLNFPVLTRIAVDTTSGTTGIRGTLQAAPDTSYRLDLFNVGTLVRPHGADAMNHVTTLSVTTDAAGQAVLSETAVTSLSPGNRVTATLTDTANGYTSEISDALAAVAAGPTIAGEITLDGTDPFAGARVQLQGTETSVAVADQDGRFHFFDLPAGGSYTVTPGTLGYAYSPASRTFANLTTNASASFAAQTVPGVFTVNVTRDGNDGWCSPTDCTLSEAIVEANLHPGPDRIEFAIPGSGPHLITLDDLLPPLEDDLVIDGYTQPGAVANTNATGALNGVLQIGLVASPDFPTNGVPALPILGSNVTIRGLAITGFEVGLLVAGFAPRLGVVLEGNYLGTLPDGMTVRPGPIVGIQAFGTLGLRIGGGTPAARNLISGHLDTAITTIALGGGEASTIDIRGNLIGTNATGEAALPNGAGIWHTSMGTDPHVLHIGGSEPGDGNVISGNEVGIDIARGDPDSDPDDADNVIEGNLIGVAADGVMPLGNAYEGMGFCGGLKYVVRGNTVAHNGGTGVRVCTTPTTGGFGIELAENRIYDNFGLGIDLEGDGRTENDADDSDTGANELQNFPVLTSVVETLGGAIVTGELTSEPQRSYRIELFTTGPLGLDGMSAREFLTAFTVTTDVNGQASFSEPVPGPLGLSESIIATATDELRMMTSELSDTRALTPLPRVTLSGLITRDGAPVSGVAVSVTGTRTGAAQTGADGRYAIDDLPIGGSYTVTPAAAGLIFTPPQRTFAALAADATADFTAERVLFTRYLTEGAAGPFWETTIALLNASNAPTTAQVAFLLADGRQETLAVPLTGPGHAVIDPATIPALDGATFSTRITAPEPLVASRTMRWGTQRELGAHAEQALNEPRTSWYFAEGATGCFDLFYLLVNPGGTAAQVDVTFARRAPDTPIVQRYTVDPYARATIHVNGEQGLASVEVSAYIHVINGQPIVAERAMYANCFGDTWRGGHDAVASAAPALEWFFAEGATGTFFDLYLLLANFEGQDAETEIEYLFEDGTRLVKPHRVEAGSRLTVDVAGESPLLAHTIVSASVRSKNNVPIVAERSQWWPHGAWYEGHASAGVTSAGVEWQIAGAAAGGPHGVQSYLLIANTAAAAGRAQVRAIFSDGTTAVLPTPLTLAPFSRTTVELADAFPEAVGRTFGLVVESLAPDAGPGAPAPIVVELSSYNDTTDAGGSRFWGAGTNIVATRVR